MTFTKDQRTAVEKTGTLAVTIDGIECVILRADVYANVLKVIGSDDPELTYAAVLQAWDAVGSPHDADDYR